MNNIFYNCSSLLCLPDISKWQFNKILSLFKLKTENEICSKNANYSSSSLISSNNNCLFKFSPSSNDDGIVIDNNEYMEFENFSKMMIDDDKENNFYENFYD